MVMKFFNESVDQVETITRLRRHSKYSTMSPSKFLETVISVFVILDIDEEKLEAIKHDVALIIDVQDFA